MAHSAISFSGQTSLLISKISCKNKIRLTLNHGFSLKGSNQHLKKEKMKMNGMYLRNKKQEREFLSKSSCRMLFVKSSVDDANSASNPSSAYDIIMRFYSSINGKDLYTLSGCISEDCHIEDFSFPQAFQGRKEALKFFDQLVKSMGQNVKFCVENVCEGNTYTAAVNWHLEWKERQIPFTRGCSFYEFSEGGESLVIRKATVLIESPIKPGGVVLTLLKNVTFLFDEFPRAAEWFLEKPYAIIQFLARVYVLFLAPFINHILSGYLKLLNLVAEFFLLALKIIIKIRSFFPK